MSSLNLNSGAIYGFAGATSCLILSCLGAAYGTSQAGVGLCRGASRNPSITIKGIIPVAMAGVRGIYGLVLSIIIIASALSARDAYSEFSGLAHLCAGICCGMAQFTSGITVGVVGESSTQAIVKHSRLFAPSILILIFSEALALYGLISGMILVQSGQVRP